MKTLFRIFAVLFVLLLVALVGGYFALTNAGVQKRLVEKQLPEGSSIESIHVTTGKVELSGLVLMLPDGTRVAVGAVDTAFEPLAAVFDQTIKMGVLTVEGLRIDLPAVTAPTVAGSAPQGGPRDTTTPSSAPATEEEASTEPTNPMEALNALGNFEWLLDIEGIALEGVIHDGQGSKYVVRIDSPAIRPGESSTIDASLQLLTDAPLASGLKAFDSTAKLSFKQKLGGGFESLKLQSDTSGKDAQGLQLIAVQQALDLEVDDVKGVATVSVDFNADLPKPQILAPELASLGALKAKGHAVASTDGKTMTLSEASLNASASGADLISLDLKRSMIFGGTQDLTGDLLDITVTALQLEWLNPWLSGLQIQSQAPVSLTLSVAGAADGAFALTFAEPIQLGPLTVTEAGTPLVQDVVVMVAPEFQVSADQLKYALNSLSVADRYGVFIQGSSNGVIQLDATRDAANPFAGVQSKTALQIGLQEVFQLPVLAGSASIVSGQLSVDARIDESADQPLQVQATIKGLRASSLPSMTRDYDVSLGLSHTSNPGELKIAANLLAGPASRPSTDVKLSAVVNPSQLPATFSAEVSSPRVTQEDISILTAAFTPREQAQLAAPTPSHPSDVPVASKPQAPRGTGVVVSSAPVPPAWAMLDGRVSVSVDELRLEAGHIVEAIKLKVLVSEPKLLLDPISAKIGDGAFNGSSSVLYESSQLKPYTLTADIRFSDIDPALFVKKQKSAPVQGQFDGVLQGTGVGTSLDAAVEDGQMTIRITGKNGVLTAFELDERQQLGLGLAGLIGQSLDRPGIAALSHTIPYFKDIHFDNFAFELTRGVDKRFVIPELRLTGESVLLDASGSVGASQLSEVMNQPLDLKMELGAKGKLTKYLETLELLQPTTAADGFTRWNQGVQITGSLNDPDTGALMDLLNAAAKGALSKSKKEAPVATTTDATSALSSDLAPQGSGTTDAAAPEETKKKSKSERRSEDIEMGLDLLNSFLGN